MYPSFNVFLENIGSDYMGKYTWLYSHMNFAYYPIKVNMGFWQKQIKVIAVLYIVWAKKKFSIGCISRPSDRSGRDAVEGAWRQLQEQDEAALWPG